MSARALLCISITMGLCAGWAPATVWAKEPAGSTGRQAASCAVRDAKTGRCVAQRPSGASAAARPEPRDPTGVRPRSSAPADPSEIVLAPRVKTLERENTKLKRDVFALKVELEDVKKSGYKRSRTTSVFLLSWTAISLSYVGAASYYDVDRFILPSLVTGMILGVGPAMMTGLGAGLGTGSITMGGVALDAVVGAIPWMVGAGVTRLLANNPQLSIGSSANGVRLRRATFGTGFTRRF
ncbi:MAG: hypothetical protein AAGI01_11090 [Myxococcota bacterium]